MFSVDELINDIDQHNSDVDAEEDNDLEGIQEGGEEENETANNNGEENDESTSRKVEKKVRKPRTVLVLNAERLKGPRGLQSMEKIFSKIEFKGHGHEREDLDQVMNTLQYWCHRLFPKFAFDDTLAHLEKIGNKRPVQTYKKKILFDMLDDDEATIEQIPQSDPIENDDILNIPDDDIPSPGQTNRRIDDFDLLMVQSTNPQQPAVVILTDEEKEVIARNRKLAAERLLKTKQAEKFRQDNITTEQNKLTDEQKAEIEKNRLDALAKRKMAIAGVSQKLEFKESDKQQMMITQQSEAESQ